MKLRVSNMDERETTIDEYLSHPLRSIKGTAVWRVTVELLCATQVPAWPSSPTPRRSPWCPCPHSGPASSSWCSSSSDWTVRSEPVPARLLMGTAELPTSYLAAHNPVYGTLRDAKKSILFKILYLFEKGFHCLRKRLEIAFTGLLYRNNRQKMP